MIVLKILMWILLVILGIILLVLILPVSAKASFIGGKFSYSLKLFFLPVMNSDKKGILNFLMKKKNKKKKKVPEDKTDIPLEENFDSDIPKDKVQEEQEENILPDKDDKSEEKTEELSDISADMGDDEPEANDSIDIDYEDDDVPEKEEKKKKIDIDFIIDLWEAADRPVLKIFKGIKLSELYIDFAIANEDAYKCALNYGRICGAIYPLLGWLSVLFNVKLKTVDIIPAFAMKKSRFDASAKVSLCLMTPLIAGIWFLIIYLFKVFIPSRKKKKSEVR